MVQVFSLVVAGVLGYLLGSIPTAYLLVRWKSHVDIRETGSGNVGTLNSYQVTRSVAVGGVVLVLDLLKGMLAVWMGARLGEGFVVPAVAGCAVVIGHNYPAWLRFQGGRGLAPGAGVMLLLAWPLVALWLAFWGIVYFLTKDVNVGNAGASILTLASSVLLPWDWTGAWIPWHPATSEFIWFSIVLFAVILTRHVRPVREYFERPSQRPG